MSKLSALEDEIFKCHECSIRSECMGPVPFEGPGDADLMVIGRNPGAAEDKLNRPFVGQAGQVLTEGLESVGIKRSKVFITNLCKCKTENNRNLRSEEVKICFNRFLTNELMLVKPRVVLILGAQPNYFLGRISSVSEHNSQAFNHKAGFRVVVSIHPAAVCYSRNKNLSKFMDSMKKVKKELSNVKKES